MTFGYDRHSFADMLQYVVIGQHWNTGHHLIPVDRRAPFLAPALAVLHVFSVEKP